MEKKTSFLVRSLRLVRRSACTLQKLIFEEKLLFNQFLPFSLICVSRQYAYCLASQSKSRLVLGYKYRLMGTLRDLEMVLDEFCDGISIFVLSHSSQSNGFFFNHWRFCSSYTPASPDQDGNSVRLAIINLD